MTSLDQIFIYGTLIPGHERWPLLEDFVTAADFDTTRGRLFDTGAGYPAARFDGTGTITDQIQGMRMTIDADLVDDCLELMDEIEGAVVGLYHRVIIDTDGGHKAWSYQYGLGFDELIPIRSGSWVRYLDGDDEPPPGSDLDTPTPEAGDGPAAVPGAPAGQGLLSFVETRVIGAMVEKELATPQNYPLSLNALVAACNQATSREPVTNLSDTEVSATLAGAKERKLARFVHPRHGRGVTKYRQVLHEHLGLDEAELALVAVLMLRGPQTSRELRDRTERLHPLETTEVVEEILGRLAERGLVHRLDRQPGRRDERWVHLLGS